jgi:hypothetical protein
MFDPAANDRRATTALAALTVFLGKESCLTDDEKKRLRGWMGEVALSLLDINPRGTNRQKLLRKAIAPFAHELKAIEDGHQTDGAGPVLGLIWDSLPLPAADFQSD